DSALCSSSLKMQPLACNYSLEKDEDTPEDERHPKAETEQPQCGRENSNSDVVPWKLPATGPLSGMVKMEPSFPEVQPPGCGASLRPPLEILSKKHCQNQWNVLHFDWKALGRRSTLPTLRRLKGRGCGSVRGSAHSTARAPPQQAALEVPPWGSCKGPSSSPHHLSNGLFGSLEESLHSLWPLRLHLRLPPDP
ncbi:hypothetical protein DBR06_SOUSAS5710044, partial [Sousa chinensis]